MKVACPSCQTGLNVDEKKIPPGGARIRCPTCKNIFPVKAASSASSSTSTVSTAGAVPLPGAVGAPSRDSGVIPLPGANRPSTGSAASIPLPGLASSSDFDVDDDWDKIPTRVGPVPGALSGVAPPSNLSAFQKGRVSDPASQATQPMPPVREASTSAIALPGAVVSSSSGAVPLPGTVTSSPSGMRSAPSGVVPLPGGMTSSPSGMRSGPSGVVPLPGAMTSSPSGMRSAPSGVVPLPGDADLFGSGLDNVNEGWPSSDDPFARPAPPAQGFGLSDIGRLSPSQLLSGPSGAANKQPASETLTDDGGFDFDEDQSFNTAPPAFTDSPEDVDFGLAAEPASPAGSADRGPLSAPSMAFDFGPPPSEQSGAAAPGYGEFDLGEGGSEFDPNQPVSNDGLEADLSQPLPPPDERVDGTGDGLEMLHFVDEAANEAGVPAQAAAVKRLHVRRRSGKVFGPFEEAVIAKMLEEGQLLGNEDVSDDAEQWKPLNEHPAFTGKAQGATAGAPAATTNAAKTANRSAPVIAAAPQGPSMEKLKALYDGRMAAVAVVEGKEKTSLKKQVPLIAAAAAVLAVMAGGVGVGLATPYGYFGVKKLFPAKVKPDTREFGYLQQARAALLKDNFKSSNEALALASQTLAIKEYPEARAIWMQAAFELQRRYALVKPEFQSAQGYFSDLQLLGEAHPEFLKAKAQEALLTKNPEQAMTFLDQALANERNQNDLELTFLRAEAYVAKKQPGQAQTEYEQVLKKAPSNARALAALGQLFRGQNKLDESIEKFTAAFKADPTQVAAGVELAELLLLEKKDANAAKTLLDEVLGPESKPNLSPFEHGKALALQGDLQVAQQHLTEAVPLFESALKVDPKNAFAKVRLGNAYLAQNKPEAALPLLKDAVTANPDRLDYTEKYLANLITLGKMDEANTVVQSASARFPGNGRIAYFSGRVADALDRAKEAEDAFKRSIAADPSNVDAHLHLARLFMRFRRFAEAKPELEKGLEKAPNSAGLRVGMGELALSERDLVRAEKEFKKCIELDPNLAEGALGLSRVALEQQKYELALVQADKALELNSHIQSGRLQRGMVLWKLGRLDESLRELEQAKVDEPRNTQAIVTQGAVAFDKQDYKKALDALSQALSTNPTHPDANFYMGRLKNAKQEHTQAIESMRRALDFNNKSPLYHYWMGRIFQDARKVGEAMEEWKATLAIEPKYADAHESIGRVYFDQGNQAQAIAEFEQVLSIDPSRNSVRALIGDALMKTENWDKAIDAYAKALGADPDLKTVYAKLGTAYEEKKNYLKAIEWYSKSTERDPDNADPWRQLGWMYKESKRKGEAMAAFSKYLELRPNADDKKDISDEVYYLKQER